MSESVGQKRKAPTAPPGGLLDEAFKRKQPATKDQHQQQQEQIDDQQEQINDHHVQIEDLQEAHAAAEAKFDETNVVVSGVKDDLTDHMAAVRARFRALETANKNMEERLVYLDREYETTARRVEKLSRTLKKVAAALPNFVTTNEDDDENSDSSTEDC